MKKLLALLIALIMMLSLTACGLGGLVSQIEDEMDNPEISQTDIGDDAQIQGDTQVKVDDSKTLDLYYDIFSGPYTLKVETYLKDFENPDNKTVSGGIFTAVDGNKMYKESTSITNGQEIGRSQLFIDEYKYDVDHEYKSIFRSPIRQNDKGYAMVMVEEDFYTDLIGEPETIEVFGEKYYSEHFSGYAESITYCYDGDDLKYIITDNGGIDFIHGVLELKKGADSSYFELPEDYDKNY